MDINFPTNRNEIVPFIKAYKYIIIGIVLLIVISISGIFAYDYFTVDPVKKAKENFEVKEQIFKDAEKEEKKALQKLKEAVARQDGKVEVYREEYEKKQTETDIAKDQTDDALDKLKQVQKENGVNVTLEEANRNRCIAFPDSQGC